MSPRAPWPDPEAVWTRRKECARGCPPSLLAAAQACGTGMPEVRRAPGNRRHLARRSRCGPAPPKKAESPALAVERVPRTLDCKPSSGGRPRPYHARTAPRHRPSKPLPALPPRSRPCCFLRLRCVRALQFKDKGLL